MAEITQTVELKAAAAAAADEQADELTAEPTEKVKIASENHDAVEESRVNYEPTEVNGTQEEDMEETALANGVDSAHHRADSGDQEDDVEKNVPEVEEEDEYREISEDGWEDILGSGRLRKKVIREGSKGKGRPNRGDVVRIKFKGYFEEKLFEEVDSLEFVISEAEVIQAIDLVVCLMNTGEVCEVISDPEFAYGDFGFKGSSGDGVPPKAAVKLELELLAHQPPVPVGDIEDVQEKLRIGRRKKEKGNFWYQRQNYTFAVQCYRKAGEYFDDERLELEVPIDRYELPQELQTLLEERLKAFNNLAMSQMKIEAWDAALASLRQVTKIEPNNEKALYRKSKVLTEKGMLDEALGILRRTTRLFPNNLSAKTDLAKLVGKQKESLLFQQNMSRKMLGLDKVDLSKQQEKNKGWAFLSKKVLVTSALVGLTSLALGGGYFAYTSSAKL